MRKLNFILNQYDGAANHCAHISHLQYWRELCHCWAEDRLDIVPRELGALSRNVAAHFAQESAAAGDIPIILGGDHSITFHILRSLVAVRGPITVVHFDAHHDAFPGAYLTNYTVLSEARRLLPVDVVPVGYRYESNAPAKLTGSVAGPLYVSFDVDYFAPNVVRCVGHPVPAPPDGQHNLGSAVTSIEFLQGDLVGADIVEWFPSALADDGERRTVEAVVTAICKKARVGHSSNG